MRQNSWKVLSVAVLFFCFLFQPLAFSEDPFADQALMVKAAGVMEQYQSRREAVIREYQQKLEAIQKEQDAEIQKTLNPTEWARYKELTTPAGE